MSKILITGSSGFVGQNLIDYFGKEEVLIPPSKDLNLLNSLSVSFYFKEHRPKTIIHLAAICGGIGLNKRKPADLTHLNLKMLVNIFDAIRDFDVEYFYGLGSVCSYYEHCPTPFKEDNMWMGHPEPTNRGYGESKRMMITEFQEHKKQFGLKGAVLVPVNLYGKKDHFDLENSHVIPAFINKFTNAVENNEPEVKAWGSGICYREFLFVEDLCRAIKMAVTSGLDYSEPINIGTGKDISIKDLAYLIKDLTGFAGDVKFTGEVSDGQPKRRLDVSRAKKVLGFEAEIDLETGLKETIEWYKNERPEV